MMIHSNIISMHKASDLTLSSTVRAVPPSKRQLGYPSSSYRESQM